MGGTALSALTHNRAKQRDPLEIEFPCDAVVATTTPSQLRVTTAAPSCTTLVLRNQLFLLFAGNEFYYTNAAGKKHLCAMLLVKSIFVHYG